MLTATDPLTAKLYVIFGAGILLFIAFLIIGKVIFKSRKNS